MSAIFDWARLGDIDEGRTNLGADMPVVVYRLLQYTLADELQVRYGFETAESIMKRAGYHAGKSFCHNVIEERDSISLFFAELQNKLKGLKIGVLRVEQVDMTNLKFVLTISEDLDCSGLPISGETVCTYDEGFLEGIFEEFTGQPFEVVETDCWASGDRTCRFSAQKKEESE